MREAKNLSRVGNVSESPGGLKKCGLYNSPDLFPILIYTTKGERLCVLKNHPSDSDVYAVFPFSNPSEKHHPGDFIYIQFNTLRQAPVFFSMYGLNATCFKLDENCHCKQITENLSQGKGTIFL